jgi:hypothetical protein
MSKFQNPQSVQPLDRIRRIGVGIASTDAIVSLAVNCEWIDLE